MLTASFSSASTGMSTASLTSGAPAGMVALRWPPKVSGRSEPGAMRPSGVAAARARCAAPIVTGCLP